MNETMEEQVKWARGIILEARQRFKRIVPGPYQAFAADILTDTWFVPTQVEDWARPVNTVLLVGTPGSGKTVMAKGSAQLIRAKSCFVTGLGDMTPSQLVGHVEFIEIGNGKKEKIHVPGAIDPEADTLIIDEFTRANREIFNAIAQVLSEGRLNVGGLEVGIAPGGRLRTVFTANPQYSSGTKEPGEFLADRIIAAIPFQTLWEDDLYLDMLNFMEEHWENLRKEGILEPCMELAELLEAEKIFNEMTIGMTPPYVKAYLRDIERAFVACSRPEWAAALRRDGLLSSRIEFPRKWQEKCEQIPDAPLIQEPGGRVPQHLSSLARADSFLTFGSLAMRVEAVQRAARAVFFHRVMYKLGEGGLDILHKAYHDLILPFVAETIDWIISTVPFPREG